MTLLRAVLVVWWGWKSACSDLRRWEIRSREGVETTFSRSLWIGEEMWGRSCWWRVEFSFLSFFFFFRIGQFLGWDKRAHRERGYRYRTISKGKRGIEVRVQEEVKNFLFSDLRKRVKTKGGGRYQGGWSNSVTQVTECECDTSVNGNLILKRLGKVLKASVGLTWHKILFVFHSIDTEHLHEETFRKIEALKMSKPGMTW